MQAPWWWSKTETCRSDIHVYFNVNFNVFFKTLKVNLLVSELYSIRMHGATIKNHFNYFLFFCARVFYWTILPILYIIQHRIIVRSMNNHLGKSSIEVVLARRQLQGHYLIWQLSVGTSCRLVYRINVTHTRSEVAARRDKRQLSHLKKKRPRIIPEAA